MHHGRRARNLDIAGQPVMREPTQLERMATLEVEVHHLSEAVSNIAASQKSMDEKLTAIVSLKDQGRGVLWLLGIIWASGVLGGLVALWHWLKG